MGLYDYDRFTFQDAVEQLLDTVVGADPSERNRRSARRAVVEAYRDLPSHRDWNCFKRRMHITTAAPYSTGTITYTHTGGAYERLVTLASGTWPANARYYKIVIADVIYDVEDRKSDTQLTLTEAQNPGANVAAGTSYRLWRDTYPLPANFAGLIGDLIDTNNDRQLTFSEDPADLLLETEMFGTTQEPYMAALVNNPHYAAGLAIQFSPPPNSARTYATMAKLRPRPLAEELHQEGTVAITAGSTTVTGSATHFLARHAGCVFRVHRDTNDPPTSLSGSVHGFHAPFEHQAIVKAYVSATELTLEAAPTLAFAAGSKYTLSDPIDLEVGAMLTYFQRLAEARMARIENREGATAREAAAQRALAEAAWADLRRPGLEPWVEPVESLADLAGEVTTDA